MRACMCVCVGGGDDLNDYSCITLSLKSFFSKSFCLTVIHLQLHRLWESTLLVDHLLQSVCVCVWVCGCGCVGVRLEGFIIFMINSYFYTYSYTTLFYYSEGNPYKKPDSVKVGWVLFLLLIFFSQDTIKINGNCWTLRLQFIMFQKHAFLHCIALHCIALLYRQQCKCNRTPISFTCKAPKLTIHFLSDIA